MITTFVATSAVHLLVLGLLAALPPQRLVRLGRGARVGLGALCGLAGLAADVIGSAGAIADFVPMHPALLACAAFLWGPLAGAAAACLALAGTVLETGAAVAPAALVVGSGAGAGLLWWLARGPLRMPAWAAAAGLVVSLPFGVWEVLSASGLAPGLDGAWWHNRVPWQWVLALAVVSGGAALLRSRAQTLLSLGRREEDLVTALRASGSGRWEWNVRERRFSYGGRLFQRLGLPESPDDGSLASLRADGAALRRWRRERQHPEDRREWALVWRQWRGDVENALQAETRLLDDHGRWRWIAWRGHAVEHDADGRVLRMAGMCLDVSEQRELRDALRTSQARYTALYQTLPDAAGVARLCDGRLLDVNPAFERLLGLPRAQIVGRTASDLGLCGDVDECDGLLRSLSEQGEVRGVPLTVRCGAERASGLMSACTADVDGQACMVFVFHDQTQALRLREELLRSNSLLSQAGRMARLGAWEIGPRFQEGTWSDVCCEMHGLPPGSALPGHYIRDFVAPEWREPVLAYMRRCVRERAAWTDEIEIVRSDGTRRWVRVRAEPVLEGGRVVRIRGILQDIDPMRRAAMRLQATEDRMARVFQMLPTPLGFTRRSDGRYVDVNPAWQAFTGFSREDALGHSSVELGICTPEVRAGLVAAAGRGDGQPHEMQITIAGGAQRTVLQSLCAVDLDGEQCWLFALLDITERKHAEQRVREREELLSLTIAAASLGLWDWNLEQGTLSGDVRWRAMLGLEGTLGGVPAPWQRALAHAEPVSVQAELARHLAEPDKPFDITFRAATAGQAPHWIRSLGKVIARDGAGEPQRMVGMSMDVTSQRAQAEQLERMAHYDALTGLPNRVLLQRRLHDGMEASVSQGRRLGVGYLDLDGFKPVNDRLGHAVGDLLLIQVAERLAGALQAGECVARLGGDEFVILLPDLASSAQCEQRLQVLMERVCAPYVLGTERVVVTASIGYTLHPDDSADADALLRHADQAMYAAKQAGRNRFHAFDAAHERARQTLQAQRQELHQALGRGELVLYLQPKVDMRRGAVVGAEALARWKHPREGLLAPALFLPLLDGDAELQAVFGEWVVDAALRLIGGLLRQGLEVPVSINITPDHLHRDGFAQWLAARMALHPLVPCRLLHIELTESAALLDIEHAARELAAVRAHGVGISFDDFGTGYSSLSYLRRLPMDHLKLDRSFVSGMLEDEGDRAIVRGVIGLGHSFGCETIAEGVETEEQGWLLLQMGCHLAQGYCIARPMPADDFAPWVGAWSAPRSWTGSVALGAEPSADAVAHGEFE